MHDKQIHRDEFRLRVLTTNMCIHGCRNCLNDFQQNVPGYLLDYDTLYNVSGEYLSIPNNKPVVTFSGGEPALHPKLWSMLACFNSDNVILVTRESTLLQRKNYRDVLDAVCELHISIGERISERTLYMIKDFPGKVVFQKVVYEDTTYDELNTLCYGEVYPIKFFQDFYAPPAFDNKFLDMMQHLKEQNPGIDIRYRFTGVQENRGPGCHGCTKRCVTLKALWVFPDGSVSPCPQRPELRQRPRGTYMQDAVEFHKVTNAL